MLNKIMLIGNLGRDPERSYTPSGTVRTRFSLAVSRQWTDKASGEHRQETQWFEGVAWDRLAEVVNQYAHKGSRLYVEGRMTSRKYTDKDHVERTAWEVVADGVQLLDPKAGQDFSGGASQPTRGETAADGVPF
jgi:single-strand DNA-binding protein